MPRPFSEREREVIRARLLDQGRVFFRTYGVRRTNVEDLTRAAGISKGAFYLFFASKEELFFEIIERFQTEFQETFFQSLAQSDLSPRQRFRDLLVQAMQEWESNPMFGRFTREEYQHLLMKLPEERVQAHLKEDEAFAARLIQEWERRGAARESDPRMVSALVRTLFLVGLHKEEFGEGLYPRVIETLSELLAGHLVEEDSQRRTVEATA
jgi:AcrR family transcriptional regulator